VHSGGKCNESPVLFAFDPPQLPRIISSGRRSRINGKLNNSKFDWPLICLELVAAQHQAAIYEGDLMTRFFLDSQEISLPFDASSINQILKHVEDFHLSPNTVVRQIQVDGLPLLVDSGETGDLLCQIENRDKVEIFTGTIAEIAFDSIGQACEYLDRVEAAIPSLSMAFQSLPGPEDFQHLRQLYEGFYWLNLLLDKLKTNFHMNYDDALVQGIPAREHQQKFIAVLKQLIESQERSDFGLISDLLQYEILPLVPVWRELFGIVSEKVNVAH
jgi:hypothetical protein